MHADLNECANRTSNVCHENADCSNTDGNYTCSCRNGYQGDGYMCEGMMIQNHCKVLNFMDNVCRYK